MVEEFFSKQILWKLSFSDVDGYAWDSFRWDRIM
jgi:hypothetical protein